MRDVAACRVLKKYLAASHPHFALSEARKGRPSCRGDGFGTQYGVNVTRPVTDSVTSTFAIDKSPTIVAEIIAFPKAALLESVTHLLCRDELLSR
jgi:hypothetical protein